MLDSGQIVSVRLNVGDRVDQISLCLKRMELYTEQVRPTSKASVQTKTTGRYIPSLNGVYYNMRYATTVSVLPMAETTCIIKLVIASYAVQSCTGPAPVYTSMALIIVVLVDNLIALTSDGTEVTSVR